MLGLRTSRRAVMAMRRVRWMSSFFEEQGAHVGEDKDGYCAETFGCGTVCKCCGALQESPPEGGQLFPLSEHILPVWTRRHVKAFFWHYQRVKQVHQY